MRNLINTCAFSLAFCSSLFAAEPVYLGQFEQGLLEGWEHKVFSQQTDYKIVKLDQRQVLQASSNCSASGLYKNVKVDLLKTPYLNWSWRIDQHLNGADETLKSGDDYPARLFIVLKPSWKVWDTKALNYVWSSNQTIGSHWDSAVAGKNAKMLAVQGLQSLPGTWYQDKRNVYQDLIEQFGDLGSDAKNQQAYRYIDTLAIMTDTDNSQQTVTAYYGDLHFSKD